MAIVYLGIGSNIGNREGNCLQAVELLKDHGFRINKSSSFYETEPWGFEDQPAFINMALEVQTDLPPREVLALLKKIEGEMGRSLSVRWGPRIIDIDILFYNDVILNIEDLVIPHPHMRDRAFVLRPLAEIAPEKIDPVTGRDISSLLRDISGKA